MEMEVLDVLLEGKEKNISTAAKEIVALEVKRKQKTKDLWEAQKKMTNHFQDVALGKNDNDEGASASEQVSLLGGEIEGLSKVIEKAKQEAVDLAYIEIEGKEEEKKDLAIRWKKELAADQQDIIKLVKELRLLIYRTDGREGDCCHILDKGFKISIPFLPDDLVCQCRSELKGKVDGIKAGPYFTLEKIRKIDVWLDKATPESIFNDALLHMRTCKTVN